MSPRAAAVLVAVGLAAMSLAGCKSTSTTTGAAGNPAATNTAVSGATTSAATPAPTSVDVCSLLTAAQASAIIGYTYTMATPSTGQCNYATMMARSDVHFRESEPWAQVSATLTSDAGGEPLVTISGVGDNAAGDGTEVGVQSGTWIIDINGGVRDGTGAAYPKSIALAKAIVANSRRQFHTARPQRTNVRLPAYGTVPGRRTFASMTSTLCRDRPVSSMIRTPPPAATRRTWFALAISLCGLDEQVRDRSDRELAIDPGQ